MNQQRARILGATLVCILLGLAQTTLAANDDALRIRHRFRHLTIEQGLSQSTVNCFLQDRYGFVWLGTQDGLNRHDGYDFLVWKTDADDALTLSDAYITAMAEDPDGHLWVGSEASGFARFNRVTQRFDLLRTGPERTTDTEDLNYGVTGLVVDATGCVWVGTLSHGLIRYEPRLGQERVWSHGPGSLPGTEISTLHRDRAGLVWIGTDGGLACLDPATGTLSSWPGQPQPERGRARSRVEAIRQSAAGDLWVGTADGLYRWNPATSTLERRTDVDLPVHAIDEDDQQRLWLASRGHGVLRYDPKRGESLLLEPDLLAPTSLQSAKLQSIMVDASGVVWVGHDLGASLLDTHAKQFYHFKHEVGDAGSLSHNTVWAFHEDPDGRVWIATENGLNRFDPATGNCEVWPADARDPRRPSSDQMTVIFRDRRGAHWLGYARGALNVRDPASGRFRRVLEDSTGRQGAPSIRVYDIVEAADGTIWMATFHGLQSWDPETDRFTAHWGRRGDVFDLAGNACKSLQLSPDGTLWVGTWGFGVLAIDLRTGSRRHYRHQAGDSASITSDTILSLLLDSGGRIWVGTGSGLTRLDPQTGVGVRVTEKNGLPNNTIYSLRQDRDGRIWAGTNFGLVCIDPDSFVVSHYQAKDGLQSNEFNMGASMLDRRGRLYFGGINGFNVFNPEQIQANPYVPPVMVTDFQINNQRVNAGELNRGRQLLEVPIYQAESLALDHRDHVVSFGVTALHFAAPEKNRYAYRLEGFDSDWTEVGGRTRITYTNLPPGKYVLRVRGTNSDGVWNEAGAALHLKVQPPFHKTPWFLILIGVAGISAVNGIIRYRTRLMKVRTQDLEKMVARRTADLTRANHFLQQEISERRRMEEALRVAKDEAEQATQTKSEFLANVSHEIRTPMNGVLGMTSVLLESNLSSEQREHLEVVYASARNLLTIINDILDFSKIEAGKLALESIDLDLRDLVEEVGEMLGPRAHDKGLVFSLAVDPQLPACLRGDPLRIRQILVNLVSNAIKFTEHGQVSLGLTVGARTETHVAVDFSVTDTGVGIPEDRMDRLFESFSQVDTSTTRQYGGTGLGLAICKQLVELMKGDIAVTSRVGEGTTFTYRLELPIAEAEALAPLGGAALVIAPDPAVREAVAASLRHLGCQVVAPEVGDDPGLATVLALGAHPQVRVVLAGGWAEHPATRQVPRKLQAALGASAPPCLAIVNLGESVDKAAVRAEGFAGWVNRPVRGRKLRETLVNLTTKEQPTPAAPSWPDPPAASIGVAPAGPTAAAPALTAPTVPACESGDGDLPLLLAEDNPVNQKVAGILLRKLGHRVDVVGNGAEAVAALARRRYALVFMDVQMPVMDGYEAVRRIRGGLDGVLEPRVPIVALTAHAMKGDRQRCLDAGMDDYLAKPIDQKALAALLDTYLGVRAGA